MASTPSLYARQQAALAGLLRVVADGELVAEQMRCRLCEISEFDAHKIYKILQGGNRSGKSSISVPDLQKWLSMQPHSVSSCSYDDVGAIMGSHDAGQGNLHIEGFLRIVLPKDAMNAWLKEVTLARSATCYSDGTDGHIPPEVAYRLCLLLECEVDMSRHLRFHRNYLKELGVEKINIMRFFEAEPVSSVGTLVSQTNLRRILVDRMAALSLAQCDALLRRLNPSGSSISSFDELYKMLSPDLSPYGRQLSPSPHLIGCRPQENYANVELKAPSPELNSHGRHILRSPHLTGSPNDCRDQEMTASPRGYSKSLALSPSRSWSPSRYESWRGRMDGMKDHFASPRPHTSKSSLERQHFISEHARDLSRDWKPPVHPDSKSCYSPMRSEFKPGIDVSFPDLRCPGLGSTRASTHPTLSPSGYCPGGSWRHSAYPLREPLSPRRLETGSSFELLSGLSPRAASSRLYDKPSPFHEQVPFNASFGNLEMPYLSSTESKDFRARAAQHVLGVMAQQADLDAGSEDAKTSSVSHAPLEAIFATLDRFHKGYITDTDLCQFSERFGGSVYFSKFFALVHEIHLRRPRLPAATVGQLTFRELGTMVLPIGTQGHEATVAATSDAEARSMLYLLRYSEACPTCNMRVQRDADCAGCPSVTCPVCGTSFRCSIVVGDVSSAIDTPTLLPRSTQYDLYWMLSAAASTAEELERGRKHLQSISYREGVGFPGLLSSAFSYLCDGRAGFLMGDLRRAFFGLGIMISEQQLGLLWRRYAAPNSVEVNYTEFVRHLKPREN